MHEGKESSDGCRTTGLLHSLQLIAISSGNLKVMDQIDGFASSDPDCDPYPLQSIPYNSRQLIHCVRHGTLESFKRILHPFPLGTPSTFVTRGIVAPFVSLMRLRREIPVEDLRLQKLLDVDIPNPQEVYVTATPYWSGLFSHLYSVSDDDWRRDPEELARENPLLGPGPYVIPSVLIERFFTPEELETILQEEANENDDDETIEAREDLRRAYALYDRFGQKTEMF